MKKKVFLIIGTMLTVVILGYLVVAWYNYSHVKVINLEDMRDIDLSGKDISNSQDLVGIIEQDKQKNPEKYMGANPGVRIWREGVLVAYMDHEGSIMGVGNLTFNDSESRDNGYGFFSYLGDSVSKITKGWFTNLEASGDVITGNISMSGTNFSMGGCSSYWNGSCEIKSCPTTQFIQC